MLKKISNINFQIRLCLFLVTILIVVFLSNIPYINIYIDSGKIVIILYFLSVLIFKISSKLNFILAILALIISIPWVLVGSRIRVENLGIIVFLAFTVGVIQEILISKNDRDIK